MELRMTLGSASEIPYAFREFDPSEKDVVEDLARFVARMKQLGVTVVPPDDDSHVLLADGSIGHVGEGA